MNDGQAVTPQELKAWMFKFFGDHYGLLECKKALAMNERTSDAVKWLIKSDLFRI